MGVKEEFLDWCKPLEGKPTLDKWHEYNKVIDMDFSDDYFHNVVMAPEKAEEEMKEMPEMFRTDPGLIGGNINAVDMST